MPRGRSPRRPGTREGSWRRRARRALSPTARTHPRARRPADRQRSRRRRACDGCRRRPANGDVAPARGHPRDRRRTAARRCLGALPGRRDRGGGEGRRLARIRPRVRHALQARLRASARPRRAGEGHRTRAPPRDRHRGDHADTRARGEGRRRARRGGHRRDPGRAVARRRRAALPRGAGRRVKITVVGGGIIGCATAYELAKAGCAVTLFERATPGAEASSAAAGMLAPLGDASGSAFERLAVASWQLYPSVVEELRTRTGVDVEYVTRGKIYPLFDAEDVRRAETRVVGREMQEFGIEAWDTADLRPREPALATRVRGAMFVGAEHWVNNQRLVVAYAQAAVAAGVVLRAGPSGGAAIALVPSLGSLPIARTWYGFRPWAPDSLPILGPWPDVEGLWVATAHFRNGILLAPITARLMTEWMMSGIPALRVEEFAPQRFLSRDRSTF